MRDSMWSILWTEADSARVTLGGKLRLGWMSVVALMVCRVASCKANMDCMHRMLSWSSCVTLPQARHLFRRENPGKSFMWHTHLSLHSRNESVCKKFVHHCQYGSSRQKLAKFLHNTPAFSQLELGVRSCVTAKLPLLSPLVLEPHFAQSCDLAPASCYFIASSLGWVRCKRLEVAAHVLVKPWFAAPPACTFQCFVRKVKKCP